MWRPPEKIRHHTHAGPWPSVEEAAASKLFSPLKVGRMSLAQRTWVPAMVPWRASEEGFVTDDILDWYERFALGRPGAIVVEATGVRDVPSGPLLRIGHDRFVPGLKKLVETVRKASSGETRLFIQLIDFLSIKRRPVREKFIGKFLRVNEEHRQALGLDDEGAVRKAMLTLSDDELHDILSERDLESLTRGFRERVTDVEFDHIRDLPKTLPEIFAGAARRAEAAGFDGAELHYAHAYTMASFLSRLNERDDGYGGDLQGRLRLPLETFKAVRAAVHGDFIVGCRMLSEDCISGGSTVEDAAFFASEFARAGMDFISLSRGGKFEDAAEPKIGEAIYPYTGRSGYECMPQIISDALGPFGRNVEPGAKILKAVRGAGFATPIVVAGGMHAFQQAEAVLASDKADIIGFARQALADPDWFVKVKSGQGDAVNSCKYTNYCEGLDHKHKMVTCQLWDRLDLTAPNTKLTPDGKRRTTAPHWRG